MLLKITGSVGGLALLVLGLGCAVTPRRERKDVSNALRERIGYGTTPASQPREDPFPKDLNTADGLSKDEAVAIALWNNPAFQADLATLGIARAELIQAGLLRNPVLSLLFPVGPKQLEAGIAWQVESIWQRPRRVSMAQLNLESVAEGLVQNGLDLAMQVKIAYADLMLVGESAALARERAGLQTELAELAEARLRAGDVSGIEADNARAVALEAGIVADRLANGIVAARARLSGLLGIAGDLNADIRVGDSLQSDPSVSPLPDLPQLLDRAWASRPDLRAAELKIEEAGKRAGLARSEYLSIAASVDFNEEGKEGSEIGPGVALTLPLFDRGQGDKARAAAALQRALHDYAEVRNRIATQARETYAQVEDSQAALHQYRESIVRFRGDAVRLIERSYDSGEVSYRAVLTSRTRHVEALSEQARVAAELLRAQARLERAIGSDLERQPSRIARSAQ